ASPTTQSSNVSSDISPAETEAGLDPEVSETTPLLLKRAGSRASIISNISEAYESAADFFGRLSPPPMPPSVAFFATAAMPPVMAWSEPKPRRSATRVGSGGSVRRSEAQARGNDPGAEGSILSEPTMEVGSAPAFFGIETRKAMFESGTPDASPHPTPRHSPELPEPILEGKPLEKRSAAFGGHSVSSKHSRTPSKGVHFQLESDQQVRTVATSSSDPSLPPSPPRIDTQNLTPRRRTMSIDQGALALGHDPLNLTPKTAPSRRNPRRIRLSRSRFLPQVTILTDSDIPQRDVEELTRRALDRQILWAVAMFGAHLIGFGL
ncbi:hypothetical protein HDU93_006930, partial [Gonapodya sp. JEL0774]